MSEISLSKIEKAFGARKIHDKISLDISKTDRIGGLGGLTGKRQLSG